MKNIISCCTSCYRNADFEIACEYISKAGLNYVEVGLRSLSDLSDKPERVHEILNKYNLTASSAGGHTDLGSSEGVEEFKKLLDLAYRLKIKIVNTGASEVESEEDKQLVYKNIREIADYASTYGLTICLEIHPGVLRNGDECVRTIEVVDRNNVRINFDTANIYYYNEGADLMTELKKVARYIGHVHLKECRCLPNDLYFPALGKGKINFKGVFTMLNKAGFYGPFSLEIEGTGSESEKTLERRREMVEESVLYLKKLRVM